MAHSPAIDRPKLFDAATACAASPGAPSHMAQWRMLHPDLTVMLADDGRDYDAVAAARTTITVNAA